MSGHEVYTLLKNTKAVWKLDEINFCTSQPSAGSMCAIDVKNTVLQ